MLGRRQQPTITDAFPSYETVTSSDASCSRHWSPTNASSSTSSLSRRRPPRSTLPRSGSRRTSLKSAKRVWRAWNEDPDRLRWRERGGETVARSARISIFDSHFSCLAGVCTIPCFVSLLANCLPYAPVPSRGHSLWTGRPTCLRVEGPISFHYALPGTALGL